MEQIRKLGDLKLENVESKQPPTDPPKLEWVIPKDLLVDESYQRSIGLKGRRLILRILREFDWRKFKPPTAVRTALGLEVLDGQHSAIAAANHPHVKKIPVMVVDASDLSDRASTFIGINRDRMAVSAMQIHAASVLSGHDEAMAVDNACKAAGVRILRYARAPQDYEIGDTIAVRGIEGVVRRHGQEAAAELLSVLVKAQLRPVGSAEIKAAEFLLHNGEDSERLENDELTKVILASGDQAQKEAGLFAAEHGVPRWRGLASTWLRRSKKRKGKTETVEQSRSVDDQGLDPSGSTPQHQGA